MDGSIHKVDSIEIKEIKNRATNEGRKFATLEIRIRTETGTETITLFADQPEKLVIKATC